MMIEVKVKSILEVVELMGGHKEQKIKLEKNSTVADLLDKLISIYGKKLEEKIFDKSGEIRFGIAMLLNGRNILTLEGIDTILNHEDEFLILPPAGGG